MIANGYSASFTQESAITAVQDQLCDDTCTGGVPDLCDSTQPGRLLRAVASVHMWHLSTQQFVCASRSQSVHVDTYASGRKLPHTHAQTMACVLGGAVPFH